MRFGCKPLFFPLLTDRWEAGSSAGLWLICVLCRWDFRQTQSSLRLGSLPALGRSPEEPFNEQSISLSPIARVQYSWHAFRGLYGFQDAREGSGLGRHVWTGAQQAGVHSICIYQGDGQGRLLHAGDTAMSQAHYSPVSAGALIQLGKQTLSM